MSQCCVDCRCSSADGAVSGVINSQKRAWVQVSTTIVDKRWRISAGIESTSASKASSHHCVFKSCICIVDIVWWCLLAVQVHCFLHRWWFQSVICVWKACKIMFHLYSLFLSTENDNAIILFFQVFAQFASAKRSAKVPFQTGTLFIDTCLRPGSLFQSNKKSLLERKWKLSPQCKLLILIRIRIAPLNKFPDCLQSAIPSGPVSDKISLG